MDFSYDIKHVFHPFHPYDHHLWQWSDVWRVENIKKQPGWLHRAIDRLGCFHQLTSDSNSATYSPWPLGVMKKVPFHQDNEFFPQMSFLGGKNQKTNGFFISKIPTYLEILFFPLLFKYLLMHSHRSKNKLLIFNSHFATSINIYSFFSCHFNQKFFLFFSTQRRNCVRWGRFWEKSSVRESVLAYFKTWNFSLDYDYIKLVFFKKSILQKEGF